MENLPSELIVAGILGLALLLALILVKFGKQILTVLLIIAGVVVVGAVAWAVLQKPGVLPDDTAEALSDVADIARVLKPEPAAPQPAYTAPASSGGFCAGVFVTLLLVAFGVGGYFYTRWKLAERTNAPAIRQPRLQQQPPQQQMQHFDKQPPLIYYVNGDGQNGIPDIDPSQWGW